MANFVLTAQIALQAPRNVNQVVSQIRRQLQGISVNIKVNANTQALNNTNAQLATTTKSARAAEKSISDLGRSLGLAARRFGAIAIATGTFLSLSRAIKSSLGDAIEFERQFVNLSQVTGKSVKDLRDISQEITRLSTGLGVSSDQLLRTSVILAQAGLEARKTKAALEVLAKTELASSFDNIENTTEGAIAILSQFRKEAAAAGGDVAYLERALGAINDVSKRFAVESADLVAVIRRSGGAFEAAGGSLNELLALFTSVRATTRESAETIATGLRTIFTRIQRVDTIRQLQELGIALQDAEGKFVGPFEAIKRISEGLSGLDPRDFRFAAIVEELGGFRQIGKVIPLIKQFAVAQDALNVAQGASGSLAKDAEIAQQSLANQISKVKQEFQALIRDFVDSSGFQSVARGALKFASALIRIADALEPILPLIASLAALQIGKGLIPALGALTGVTRRNQGGKIHAFASGGFVPGVGNRDTVPAMMTPGEFVIRKSSVKKIGAENLQKLNKGGAVDELSPIRPSLTKRYDSGDLNRYKNPTYDTYSKPKISRQRLDLDYNNSRAEAQKIFDKAVAKKNKYKDPQKGLAEANKYIKSQTGELSQNLGAELDQPTNRSLNKIAGALAEKRVSELYNNKLVRIADRDGADFYDKNMDEYIEVKNKIATTTNDELTAKALLAHGTSQNYKNKKSENVKSLTIKLLTTNIKDIPKKNIGGMIQKFAAGGIVDVIKGNQPVGILTTDDNSTAPYSIRPDYSQSFKQQLAVAEPSIIKQGQELPYIDVNQFGLNQSAESGIGKKLRQNLISNAANAVNVTAGQMSDVFKGLGIGVNAKNLVPESEAKKAITGSVVGTMFESLVRGVSNASGSDLKDSGYFDFVGPISDQATQLFEKSGQINASQYKDAKAGAIKAQNIASKVINQAAEEYGMQGVIKSTVGTARSMEDIVSKLPAGLRADFANPAKGVTASKLKPYYKAKNVDELVRLLRDKGLDIETKPRKDGGTDIFAKNISGMATGGAASDTQPAMLTPGEFVVNKKKAQEIGYSTLHKMNKTGKIPGYAKGGVVGYANGGPVNPNLQPPKRPPGGVPSIPLDEFAAMFNEIIKAGGGVVTSAEAVRKTYLQMLSNNTNFTKAEKQKINNLYAIAKKREAAEQKLIDDYKKQQAAIQDSTDAQNKLKDRFSKIASSAQQFIFLGSAVASVAAQFSSLDRATADALTETLTFGSTILGIGGTIADLILSTGAADIALKYFTTSVTAAANAASGQAATAASGGGLMAGLMKFAMNPLTLAIAAAAAAILGTIYFFEAKARKTAEQLNKAADEILQSAEQGKGGSLESFVGTRVQATMAAQKAPSYAFTGEAEKQKEIDATRQAAASLYNMTVASRLLEEKLLSIEKNVGFTSLEQASLSINEIAKASSQASKEFAKSSQGLIGVSGGKRIEDLSGIAKTSAEDFDKAMKIAQEQMSSTLGKGNQELQKAIEASIQNYDFSTGQNPVKDILSGSLGNNLETLNKIIAEQAQVQAQEVAERAKATKNFSQAEAEIEQIRKNAARSQADNVIAAESQIEAARKQRESSALITKALTEQKNEIMQANSAIKFFSATLENISQYNKSLESNMSRLNTGITTTSVSNVQGIGNLNEIIDPKVFNDQLSKAVKPFGAFGDEVNKNLTSTAELLDKARKKLLNVSFGEADIQAAINDLFQGVNISPALKSAISGLIQDATKASSEGLSTITATEFENIFSPLIAQSEPFRKAVEGLINTQNELINANIAYLNEINKARQEEIDGKRKLVDIETRLQERLATVSQKSLSSQQKEAARNARRGFGAENRAGLLANFKQVSDDMRTAGENIKNSTDKGVVETTKLQNAQAKLSVEFNNLKGIVEELADQSERAADVMSEIDKERAKRDTLTKIVEDFVVGGNQERTSIAQSFQGVQFAAATGSLQGLDEEQRKTTFGLLSQLADVDDRFKALKQNLIFSDAVRMGLDPKVAKALATQTPKEEQLINELRAISNEEQAFQNALNENRRKETDVLSQGLGKLSGEISSFPEKLKKALSDAAQEARDEEAKIAESRISAEETAKKAAAEAQKKSEKEARDREKAIDRRYEELGVQLGALAEALRAKALEEKTKQESQPPKTEAPKVGSMFGDTKAQMQKRWEEKEAQKATGIVEQKPQPASTGSVFSAQDANQKYWEDRRKAKEAQGKSMGGIVYRASGGPAFKPKGTDTVPAMLTPGEFVMQKSAVDKYGIGVMNAINNSATYASKGAFIKYLAKGGKIEPDLVPSDEVDGSIAFAKAGINMSGENIQRHMNTLTGQKSDAARDAYQKLVEKNLEQSRAARAESMARLSPAVAPELTNFSPLPSDNPEQMTNLFDTSAIQAPSASKLIAESIEQPVSTKGYSKFRDPEYQKGQRAKYVKQRQEREARSRKIRSGEIDPRAERNAAIQEKLKTRQGNIATARYQRQQRSLPSYERDADWQNKRINPTQSQGAMQGAMQGAGMAQNPMMAQQAMMQPGQPMMNPMMAQQAMAQGGGGMGAQGFNMEPLMQLKQTFDTLTGVLNNMQMTHQVNVDGALNINGVNAPQVAEAIKTYLGEFIISEVKKIIDGQGKQFKQG
jgi:hypothetical protein